MSGSLFRLILFTAFAGFAMANGAAAQTAGGAIAAIDEPAGYGGASAGGGGGGARTQAASSKTRSQRKSSSAAVRAVKPKAPPARTKPAKWDGFVVGDKYTFLNFEVVSAAKPYHTRDAKAAGASGLVQVEVLIDQNGRVIDAKARTGNKLLHPEAERAALESRFNKPAVYGKPARAVGFLVYRFGPAED